MKVPDSWVVPAMEEQEKKANVFKKCNELLNVEQKTMKAIVYINMIVE